MSHWSHHFFALSSFHIRFEFQTVVPLVASAAISIDSLSISQQTRIEFKKGIGNLSYFMYRFIGGIRRVIRFIPSVHLIIGVFVVEESTFHGVGIVRFRCVGARGCRRLIIDGSASGTHIRFRIIATTRASGSRSYSYWTVVPAVMLRPSSPLGSVHLLHHIKFTFSIVVEPAIKVSLIQHYKESNVFNRINIKRKDITLILGPFQSKKNVRLRCPTWRTLQNAESNAVNDVMNSLYCQEALQPKIGT